jgi:uncharacterized protein (DUF58 family)
MLDQFMPLFESTVFYAILIHLFLWVLGFMLVLRSAFTTTEKAIWMVLIFSFPILGLIIFSVLREAKRKSAEAERKKPLDTPLSQP